MSDAVVDALRADFIRARNALQDAGFPSEAARQAWHAHVKDGHSGFFAQCASAATDLDAIGLVAAAHASPTARAAMLRVLLAERLGEMSWEDGAGARWDVPHGMQCRASVPTRWLLSLLAPEGPPESAGASRKADTECAND